MKNYLFTILVCLGQVMAIAQTFPTDYPVAAAPAPIIIQVEYFIDTDPGFGNGIQVPLVPPYNNVTDISGMVINIDFQGTLSQQRHTLFIRTKDANGIWSIVNFKTFDNPPQTQVPYPVAAAPAPIIIQVEYFIDTDPGFGNGIQVPLVPPYNNVTDISGMVINIDFQGTLSQQRHTLFIRTKDANGIWSIVNFKNFDNPPQTQVPYPVAPSSAPAISRVEYFIDTDPGFGNAQDYQFIQSGNVILSDRISNLPAGLTPGMHHFFVRSTQNKWSITNQKDFLVYNTPFIIAPSVVDFGSVALGYSRLDSFTIKNVSTTAKTINSINLSAPFSSTFTGPVAIAANGEITVYCSFAPDEQLFYSNTFTINTSDGPENVTLQGEGAAPSPGWSVSPAPVFNFGNVVLNNTAINTFVVTNLGNIPITAPSVEITGAGSGAYSANIPGNTIPVGGQANIQATFTPLIVTRYDAVLKVKSGSTANLSDAQSVMTGNGYLPGTLPVLQFLPEQPFNGISGVNPEAGGPGVYTYRILYKSSANLPPQSGFPQLALDRNGDHDFLDANEGQFTMNKAGTSNDYVSGVIYEYTINFPEFVNGLGYQFYANDANGNNVASAFRAGPILSNQVLDLKIFASDISFNNSNPDPNQSFTLTAQINNESPFSAINVPVSFYKDSVFLESITIPIVAANSVKVISKTFSFPTDGFYPMKVWIDPDKTLEEANVLNNYAIRPVTVGQFSLPGGINITSASSFQSHCDVSDPSLPRRVFDAIISGSAQYYGTSSAIQPMVAGAQVQIEFGTKTFFTTTNSNGNFTLLIEDVGCGAEIPYKIKVTDFTFTSFTNIGSVNVICNPKPCVPPLPIVKPGEVLITSLPSACEAVVNNTANITFSYSYRFRDMTFNFYNVDDYISHDTLLVFRDGVEVYRLYNQNNNGALIGNTVNTTIPIVLTASGLVGITFRHTYIYHEFKFNWYGYTGCSQGSCWEPTSYNPEDPSKWDWGVWEKFNDVKQASINVVSDEPNLTLGSFNQTGVSTFTFKDINTSCVNAGVHHVKIFDKPGGSNNFTQIADILVNGLGPKNSTTLPGTVSGFGTHTIKIITDANNEIAESDETDNELLNSIFVPFPDLSIDSIRISNANPAVGTSVNFKAFIKNLKNTAGSFKVSFSANGVILGSKKVVQGLSIGQTTFVVSDAFPVNNSDNSCPIKIEVFADADAEIAESDETNNVDSLIFGADVLPLVSGTEKGSASNPLEVIKDNYGRIEVPIRNLGARGVSNVKVSFRLNGQNIGDDIIPLIQPGNKTPGISSFLYAFSTAGDFTIQVTTDIDNTICEADEANNSQDFFIRVIEGKPDFEVLSQYISPSNLNPNPGQNISIVSTVKNTGTKISAPNNIRFLVDDVQLGADVAINAIQPGRDTTVQAGVMYSSPSPGARIMKVIADASLSEMELREDNNVATRALVIGNAPDFARSLHQGISFNPGGFSVGDNVIVSNYIRNYGGEAGSAWMRITIKDVNGMVVAKDSIYFTMGATDSAIISKNMLFTITKGKVLTEIVRSTPMEFNEFNNNDSLNFTSEYPMSKALTINGDIDMKLAVPDLIQEWVGGYILLGDYDLTIRGIAKGYDQTHFFVTNGKGKLKIINTNPLNIFPVGTTIHSPNFITLNNIGAADNFRVSVKEGVLSNGFSGTPINTNVVNRTWDIEEEVPGGSNASVKMYWLNQHELPGFDRTVCKTAHFIDGQWVYGDPGPVIEESVNFYSKSQGGFTKFSPFFVAGTGIATAVDTDGDGVPDESDCDVTNNTKWQSASLYIDADGDGYDAGTATICYGATVPSGYSATTNGSDCNDNDAAIHVPVLYYIDNDHDGFGSTATAMLCSSTAPTGYSTNNTDCNDNDAAIHAPVLYYIDNDHDGFGSTNTAMLCSSAASTGYSTNNTDCNDNDAAIHAPVLYYIDNDHDGFGSTNTAMLCSSAAPTGYSTNSTDCNDNDASIHAPVLYYIDNDHDGFGSTNTAMLCSSAASTGYSTNNTDCNDNDAAIHAPVLYYIDNDHDGFGSTNTAMLCSSAAPTGYSTNSTDCNDNDASIHAPVLYYIDNDHDGFGSTNTAMLCSSAAPTGYSTNNTDCDDGDAAVHAPVLYYIDNDHDGFGSANTAMLCSSAPTGYSTNNTDCDDGDAAVHPGATEILNGIDDNCDDNIDEGLNTPQSPVVNITLPADNATYLSHGNVYITADASDADGTISKVEFYIDASATPSFTSTIAPYVFKWQNVVQGNYMLTAKATDNSGLSTISSAVHISVVPNTAPTVNIVTPADNQTFREGATINLEAAASDPDGRVITVQFYDDATLLTTESQFPYIYDWQNLTAGNHTITARATDNWGAETTSADVHVLVLSNQAPAVSIINPTNNQTFLKGGTIHLEASASDADDIVAKVEFYKDATLLGTKFQSPYTFDWAKIPVGNYTITAKATDSWGAVTTSAAIDVSVVPNLAPTVNIIDPADQANFIEFATIHLEADANDPDGRIIKVQFYNGSTLLTTERVSPYTYEWQNVPAGIYTITAVTTDNWGAVTTSEPITVTVTSPVAPIAKSGSSSLNIKTDINDAASLKLAPNPANNILNIYTAGLQKNKQLTISVISALGVTMKTKRSTSSTQVVQLNVSSLINGLYTIKIISGDKVLYKQFVKL